MERMCRWGGLRMGIGMRRKKKSRKSAGRDIYPGESFFMCIHAALKIVYHRSY